MRVLMLIKNFKRSVFIESCINYSTVMLHVIGLVFIYFDYVYSMEKYAVLISMLILFGHQMMILIEFHMYNTMGLNWLKRSTLSKFRNRLGSNLYCVVLFMLSYILKDFWHMGYGLQCLICVLIQQIFKLIYELAWRYI